MVKIKVVRTDGTIIEAEGPAEELMKMNLIPWNWSFSTTTGTPGGEWYIDENGTWKQK